MIMNLYKCGNVVVFNFCLNYIYKDCMRKKNIVLFLNVCMQIDVKINENMKFGYVIIINIELY